MDNILSIQSLPEVLIILICQYDAKYCLGLTTEINWHNLMYGVYGTVYICANYRTIKLKHDNQKKNPNVHPMSKNIVTMRKNQIHFNKSVI